MKFFLKEDINKFERRFRANLINSISGFKSANLIGTKSKNGVDNLAIFNSVFHLGANPPLQGFVMRPTTVERHTYSNIIETGLYTINHVSADFLKAAHHTSAKYPKGVSEFDKSGLTADYIDDFPVPFVKESALSIGMKFIKEMPVEINGTIIMIGQIEWIKIDPDFILTDGNIDLEAMKTVAMSGLYIYYEVEQLGKLAYEKPKE